MSASKHYWICQAHPEFQEQLNQEIKLLGLAVLQNWGLFYLFPDHPIDLCWAQNTWTNVHKFQYKSIGDAQKILKEFKIPFYGYSIQHHRRTELIKKGINLAWMKPMAFHPNLDLKKARRSFGSFLVQDENVLWVSTQVKSSFENGIFPIEETKEAPSRAYQKLWEYFSIYATELPHQSCLIDLGAAPGGWSWVLSQFDCKVISVDKAEMDPQLLKSSKIEWLKKDAFTLRPTDFPQVEWVFCDIICEPKRTLELIQSWLSESKAKHFVFTIKFKGNTDFAVIENLKAIPNSQLVHLSVNKHELTWFLDL